MLDKEVILHVSIRKYQTRRVFVSRIKSINAIIFSTICFSWIAYGLYEKNKLKNNHKIGIAYVYDYSTGGLVNAGSLFIDFKFEVNGKTYKSSCRYTTSDVSYSDFRNYFFIKHFQLFIIQMIHLMQSS